MKEEPTLVVKKEETRSHIEKYLNLAREKFTLHIINPLFIPRKAT